jgi:hypothetical protein
VTSGLPSLVSGAELAVAAAAATKG